MKYNKLKLIELIGKDKHSYAEIGLKVFLHSNMVGKIVRGESIPSLESLPHFAEYYKKDMNFFFDIESTAESNTPSVQMVTPEFLLKRYEELVLENGKLKDRVNELEGNKKYSNPSGTSLMVADPQTQLKK